MYFIVLQGRRWSDGLHQAVEAKESLPIQNETVTLASISYQNFFLQVLSIFVIFRGLTSQLVIVVEANGIFTFLLVPKTLWHDWHRCN